MLGTCENWPDFDETTNFVRDKVTKEFGNAIIQFDQLEKVDSSTLIKVELNSSDFTDMK